MELKCCLFKQYARVAGTHTAPAVGGSDAEVATKHFPASDTYTEDCKYVWKDESGAHQSKSALFHDAPAPGKTFDYKGDPAPPKLSCFGKKGPEQPDQNFDPADRDNECTYWMRDYPGVPVAPDSQFAVHFEFLGRIMDRCNPPRIAAEKEFSLLLVGWVGPSGEVTYVPGVATGSPAAALAGNAPLVMDGAGGAREEGSFEDIHDPSAMDLIRLFEDQG